MNRNMCLSLLHTIKIFLLFNSVSNVISLKDLRISVPEAVTAGDTVTLSCYFDLENAALYSVRWYLDQEEFYRYVPKDVPPHRVFPISDVSIDLNQSTENSVVLQSVSRNQSGYYQCEVSADAPLFHTEAKSATMLVVEFPKSEPVITIYGMPGADNKRIVTLGETFKAICVSGPSFPPVNFTWLVNNVRYPSTHSGLQNMENVEHDISLKEAWSELVVHTDNHIITTPNNRKLIVRCETTIYNLYKDVAEAQLDIIEGNYWTYGGGRVSPTIDQRGNRGDPDNSALTGYAIRINYLFSTNSTVEFLLIWLLIFISLHTRPL